MAALDATPTPGSGHTGQMSIWEERMSQNAARRVASDVAAKRRAYLGEAFLQYWPPDVGLELGFAPMTDGVLPQIIAAACLGITYGDPGPRLPEEMCRECWGDRHVWLGNCWGVHHAGGSSLNCKHSCHDGEVWLAPAPPGLEVNPEGLTQVTAG